MLSYIFFFIDYFIFVFLVCHDVGCQLSGTPPPPHYILKKIFHLLLLSAVPDYVFPVIIPFTTYSSPPFLITCPTNLNYRCLMVFIRHLCTATFSKAFSFDNVFVHVSEWVCRWNHNIGASSFLVDFALIVLLSSRYSITDQT